MRPAARILALTLSGLSLLGAGSAVLSLMASNAEEPRVEMRIRPAGPAGADVIGALGTVEPPGRIIEMAASVQGIVSAVAVRSGQRVSAGDVLFEIEASVARAAVAEREAAFLRAEAALAETVARADLLTADAAAARAALAAADGEADEAEAALAVGRRLAGGSAISARDIETRVNRARTARARVEEARARLERIEVEQAQLSPGGAIRRVQEASVRAAFAALLTAQTELALRTVRAPVDALVLAVDVRPGEAVGTAPVLLGRPGALHVRAEIDETDVPRLRDGPRCTDRTVPARLRRGRTPHPRQAHPERILDGAGRHAGPRGRLHPDRSRGPAPPRSARGRLRRDPHGFGRAVIGPVRPPSDRRRAGVTARASRRLSET